MPDDEAELVRECLAGEPAGLRAFVARFQSMVFALCFRMLGHRQDAEDVVQEVFIRAFRSLHQWDSSRPLKPWLLTIAGNRCRTMISTRPRTRLLSIITDPETDSSAASSATDCPQDLAEELQKALEQVRPEYRLCFILHHQDELNLAQISEIVGAPEGTIKTWLFRVRQELASHLRRRGIEPQQKS